MRLIRRFVKLNEGIVGEKRWPYARLSTGLINDNAIGTERLPLLLFVQATTLSTRCCDSQVSVTGGERGRERKKEQRKEKCRAASEREFLSLIENDRLLEKTNFSSRSSA